MTRKYLPLAVVALGFAAAALAAPPAPQRPEAFEALVRCRAITDEHARLACFDAAVARFEAAAASRDVVVVDRRQIRETRRSLFGLNLPSLPFFGGGDAEDKAEEVNQIEGVAAAASQDGAGNWVIRLQEGGTWRQTDGTLLGRRPRAGSKVVVRRATMGSFMMRIDGQPGVRAKREN